MPNLYSQKTTSLTYVLNKVPNKSVPSLTSSCGLYRHKVLIRVFIARSLTNTKDLDVACIVYINEPYHEKTFYSRFSTWHFN